MGHFDTAFLAGSLRVTVENKCPSDTVLIEFDRGWIRKFTASVAEDHREHLHEECSAQLFIQSIENVRHGSCRMGFSEKGQHQGTVPEE